MRAAYPRAHLCEAVHRRIPQRLKSPSIKRIPLTFARLTSSWCHLTPPRSNVWAGRRDSKFEAPRPSPRASVVWRTSRRHGPKSTVSSTLPPRCSSTARTSSARLRRDVPRGHPEAGVVAEDASRRGHRVPHVSAPSSPKLFSYDIRTLLPARTLRCQCRLKKRWPTPLWWAKNLIYLRGETNSDNTCQ